MAAAYTKELLRGRLTGQGQIAGPVPPEGLVWVVRDIAITNLSPSPLLHQLYLSAPGGSIALVSVEIESEQSFHLELRQAFLAPWQLLAITTSPLSDYSVTGYELTA